MRDPLVCDRGGGTGPRVAQAGRRARRKLWVFGGGDGGDVLGYAWETHWIPRSWSGLRESSSCCEAELNEFCSQWKLTRGRAGCSGGVVTGYGTAGFSREHL